MLSQLRGAQQILPLFPLKRFPQQEERWMQSLRPRPQQPLFPPIEEEPVFPWKRLRVGSRHEALIRHSPEWVLRTINL